MWSSGSDLDESASTATAATACSLQPQTPPPPRRRRSRNRRRAQRRVKNGPEVEESEAEAEEVWCGAQWEAAWPRRARPVVLAGEDAAPDGAGAGAGDSGVGRARSLTDDDLEELKGCVDLGFGFSYNEIPELCGTLPALELCYSMSPRRAPAAVQGRRFGSGAAGGRASSAGPAHPQLEDFLPWDSPDEVKARLKYWAQAVACTVKLCS
ncbi:unnamed protein product [Triticum turgidum subsp. durum]|uniref:Uncharacterized protein n=1 Tax=Triticum turgidum subsp. durum TaxID=4567 RepID=A0A9R0W1U9_TRITD|nr:unnamed protein product [Triticum turgidum subsp. durum]